MSREPFVGLRFLAILTLGLTWGGCSFLFVTGPPPRVDRSTSVDCTTSNGWPAFDLIYGTLNTAVNIWAAQKGGPQSSTYTAGAIGSALLWGSSAIVGFGRTSRCREALGLDEDSSPDESTSYEVPTPRRPESESTSYEVPTPGRPESASSMKSRTRGCPGGMHRVDSVHCCWPGQRFIVDGASCRGTPICPPGMVASGATCTPPDRP
jgi:hypothetical protein